MPGLYDLLSDAQDGEAVEIIAGRFGLSPRQTEAAVSALLPAISAGLKQSTATPEGLGNLLATMGHQRDLHAMYDDPELAFSERGRAAGDDALAAIFGSKDASRAVADQAQRFSGIDSGILKKLLPVIAGVVLSGLMRGRSGSAAAPQEPAPSPGPGGGGTLGDILGQIFGRGTSAPSGGSPSPQPIPAPRGPAFPGPTGPGAQPAPGGDILGQILQELQKGIQEGRIKPVIIGGGPFQLPLPGGQGGPVQMPRPGGQDDPVRIPMPGGQRESAPSAPQVPGGDILGQILRDMLGGGAGAPSRAPQRGGRSPELKDLSDLSRGQGVMGGVGAAVFGDRFEVGRDVEQRHLDDMQGVLDRFIGVQRR